MVKTADKPATKKPAVKKTIKKMSRLAATKKKRAPKKKANPKAPKKKKLASNITLQVNVRNVHVRNVMGNVSFSTPPAST